MVNEIWKPLKDFQGYEISDQGRIRSFWKKRGTYRKGTVSFIDNISKILRTIEDSQGYKRIVLRVNGKQYCRQVHRLVLETFVGPCPKGLQTRHLDGNSGNNKLENLKWGTVKENFKDKLLHGNVVSGSRVGTSKLDESDVFMMRICLNNRLSQKECSEIWNISRTEVSYIKLNKIWKHVPWVDMSNIRREFDDQDAYLIKFCLAMGISCKECALIFNSNKSTITSIKKGRSKEHVPWPIEPVFYKGQDRRKFKKYV